VITGGPGLDTLLGAPGEDRAVADAQDIVGTDCETSTGRRGRSSPCGSLDGALLGQTGARFAGGRPLHLLWAAGANLFLSSTYRGAGFCFISVAPA
jgi:hypothetical protein